MRAAVLPQPNEPLEIVDDLDVAGPRAGEVRVWITHCGLCHSDLYTMDGTFRSPMPMVLGHEAAGEVESVGAGVRHVVAGDKVAITPMPSCGRCHPCITGHPTLCDDARNWADGLLPDGTSPFSRSGRDRLPRQRPRWLQRDGRRRRPTPWSSWTTTPPSI